jgi:hypothetical protein
MQLSTPSTCSQELATALYPEAGESIPHSHLPVLMILFSYLYTSLQNDVLPS